VVRNLKKVIFPLDAGAWHGSATESVWVDDVGKGRYVLENSPFYAFGVSYQDVVSAKEVDGELVFDEVISRGGHSTYRLMVSGGHEDFDCYWKSLQQMGCTYEEGLNRLISVDVPPLTDIYAAYNAFVAGEQAGVWSFEEGHCGHPIQGETPTLN